MTQFIAAIFPDKPKAVEGRSALQALHDNGDLTLYAAAVLLGLLGGPALAAFGVVAGATSGGFLDLLKAGARRDFLEEVSSELAAGKSAVIAEVSEDQGKPLDSRMEALGGVILRDPHPSFDEDGIEEQAVVQKAALAQLEAEQAGMEEANRVELRDRVAETRKDLGDASERARERMVRLGEETEARIGVLQAQTATASAETKARLERRIAETRAEHERRSAKLRRAWELAREAFES
jgi:uncharacterized membrane protein